MLLSVCPTANLVCGSNKIGIKQKLIISNVLSAIKVIPNIFLADTNIFYVKSTEGEFIIFNIGLLYLIDYVRKEMRKLD
jgi:hypothetical protein